MRVMRITKNVRVADIDAAKAFYIDFLGVSTEKWGVRRFFVRAPDGTVLNIVAHHD